MVGGGGGRGVRRGCWDGVAGVAALPVGQKHQR